MDPITIGLAFSAAQAAVSHIKQAIALGKDVNGIIGFVGNFFQAADAVHIASIKAKHSSLGKSDAELSKQALEFAMHSNQLREDERALKDMIIWQLGKPRIWEDMINERTRLLKEKREAEAAVEKANQEHKEKMTRLGLIAIYVISFGICFVAVGMLGVQAYGILQEQKQYEIKQSIHAKVKAQQQLDRELQQKKELDAYTKPSN